MFESWTTFFGKLGPTKSPYDKGLKSRRSPYTTFSQVREHLPYLGCRYGQLNIGYSRTPLVYFENEVNGATYDVVIKAMCDTDPVPPTDIQSWCDQLHIDPAEFGFNLPKIVPGVCSAASLSASPS